MFENTLSFLLSVAAVAIAFGIITYGFYKIRAMLADLQKLEDGLLEARSAFDEIHSPNELADNFEERHELLSAANVVGTRWRAYRRRLVVTKAEVLSPEPASEAFGYELLYSPELHLRRHEAVPNQLVGIGLFFTFVGLALSLWIASSGLQGDVESAKTSLIALMSASAIKFVTSIAAIFSALLFTHFKNQRVAQLHSSVEQFANRIDWLIPPISSEAKAGEMCELMRLQNMHLEQRNDELAKTIATELDATLQTSLKDALKPIADEINGMAETMGEISENTMRHMIEKFSKELGSAALEHSKRMADLLEAVSQAVEKVPANIEQSSNSFSTAMEASAHKIEETFGQSSRNLMQVLENTAEIMSSSASGWSEVSGTLTALTKEISGTQDAFGKRLDAVHAATDNTIAQIQAMAAELKSATENLPAMDEVAAKLELASTALDRSVLEIGKLEGISDEARTRASDAARQFAESISTIEREMKALDASMAAVFRKTGDGLSDFKKQAESITGVMDKQLGQAVDRLAVTVQKYSSRREAAE